MSLVRSGFGLFSRVCELEYSVTPDSVTYLLQYGVETLMLLVVLNRLVVLLSWLAAYSTDD